MGCAATSQYLILDDDVHVAYKDASSKTEAANSIVPKDLQGKEE
jgi:hypothetical protein